MSKYDFITKNYDFTTNLKKISMEDLKNLAQSNTIVNSTIDNNSRSSCKNITHKKKILEDFEIINYEI